jgi:hypothetical protein
MQRKKQRFCYKAGFCGVSQDGSSEGLDKYSGGEKLKTKPISIVTIQLKKIPKKLFLFCSY